MLPLAKLEVKFLEILVQLVNINYNENLSNINMHAILEVWLSFRVCLEENVKQNAASH